MSYCARYVRKSRTSCWVSEVSSPRFQFFKPFLKLTKTKILLSCLEQSLIFLIKNIKSSHSEVIFPQDFLCFFHLSTLLIKSFSLKTDPIRCPMVLNEERFEIFLFFIFLLALEVWGIKNIGPFWDNRCFNLPQVPPIDPYLQYLKVPLCNTFKELMTFNLIHL